MHQLVIIRSVYLPDLSSPRQGYLWLRLVALLLHSTLEYRPNRGAVDMGLLGFSALKRVIVLVSYSTNLAGRLGA